VQHRVFGPLERVESFEQWTGRVRIDFFSGHAQRAGAQAEGPGPADRRLSPGEEERSGEFELRLTNPAGGGEPSRKQEVAFLGLLAHTDKVCNRVADAIYNHYRCHWGDWREPARPGARQGDDDEVLIPELSSRDGLKDLIRLLFVNVIDYPGIKKAVLGFCFTCSWDGEHGLGVLVRDGQVVEIGENDLTWRGFPSSGEYRPKTPTKHQLAIQYGIAAVKRLGGKVRCESGDVEVELPRNNEIDDADLTALAHFPDLRQLRLASPRVTDAGLDVLRGFKNLRLLELSGAAITDQGLKRLRGLKRLVHLYLTGTRITDAGLTELRRLPALAGLHLGGTGVTDAGMKELGAFRGLQHLDVSETTVTDAGVRALAAQPGWVTLDLRGTHVTDAAMATLKEFHSLRYLSLSGGDLTDRGLEPLKGLKSLRSLKLASTTTTDAGIADLQRAIPGLQVVR
jgi:hypothetical protein